MKNVLFVQGLKKNLLSISALDAKGMRVSFIDGQVLMWPKGKAFDDATIIGEQEGGLYKLKGQIEQLWFMTQSNQMHFGIEVLHMCITEQYLLQAKLLEGKNKSKYPEFRDHAVIRVSQIKNNLKQ